MRRKWSPASKLFAVLAVVFAAGAFGIVRGYAARVQALTPALGGPSTVLVAARDLPRGARLTDEMLRPVSFPSRFVPPGAIRRDSAAVGRTLVAALAAGEVVTRTRLAPIRAGPVAALAPEGLRAFSVATSLPSGAVRPGDRIDVLATFAGGRPHTETVASEIEVLLVLPAGGAVGSPTGLEADTGEADVAEVGAEGETLALLVRPDEAERLAYARAFADLSISVAGAADPSE